MNSRRFIDTSYYGYKTYTVISSPHALSAAVDRFHSAFSARATGTAICWICRNAKQPFGPRARPVVPAELVRIVNLIGKARLLVQRSGCRTPCRAGRRFCCAGAATSAIGCRNARTGCWRTCRSWGRWSGEPVKAIDGIRQGSDRRRGQSRPS